MQIKDDYGPDLDSLKAGTTLGLLIDDDSALHVYVNDVDQGVAATNMPRHCHVIVDVYGQCEQISIVTSETQQQASQCAEYSKEKANMEEGMYVLNLTAW